MCCTVGSGTPWKEAGVTGRKWFTAEQIIRKLREAEVLTAKGK
ncbi:MAG TPA: hypothetical protein VNA25_07225 [Phycisphaerae bacterium]|nr:hypothetical protein [Phycisphaerae bacterium]